MEDELLLELKTVERVLPIHCAQILTYLKLLKVSQGLLINFNSRRLVDGLKSVLAGSQPSPHSMGSMIFMVIALDLTN